MESVFEHCYININNISVFKGSTVRYTVTNLTKSNILFKNFISCLEVLSYSFEVIPDLPYKPLSQ